MEIKGIFKEFEREHIITDIILLGKDGAIRRIILDGELSNKAKDVRKIMEDYTEE